MDTNNEKLKQLLEKFDNLITETTKSRQYCQYICVINDLSEKIFEAIDENVDLNSLSSNEKNILSWATAIRRTRPTI